MSTPSLQAAVHALGLERLRGMRRGVEKESLRTQADGRLALTPHPRALGSALTHPHITTDYSESQLELITGVHASVQACAAELTQIHQFVYRSLGQESMWVGSMPCGLPPDENIPIGSFGSSNVGRAKSVYRMGLGHRYGRRMQTISGIHYNWSLPGVGSDEYFALIRNFPAGSKSSMLEDLERGRRLELPWLSGAVVRLGKEVGVPTPTHQFISAVLTPFVNGKP